MALIIPLNGFAQSFKPYRVHQNDNLSMILFRLKVMPLYGNKGSIQQTLKLNPNLKNNGHFLKPGQVILLPVSEPIENRSLAQEPPTAPTELPPKLVTTTENKEEAIHEPVAVVESPSLQSTEPSKKTADSIEVPSKELEVPQVLEGFEPYSNLKIQVGASYLGLIGIDPTNNTQGRLLSKLSPGLAVSWQQVWDPDFYTRIFIKYQSITFAPEETGITLSNSSVAHTSMGFGLGSQFSSRWSWHFDLEWAQGLHYRGLSSGGLEILQKPMMKLTPSLEYDLLQKGPFSLSTQLGYSYWSPTTYSDITIHAGQSFDAHIKIEQTFKRSAIDCQFGYKEKRQNSSILNLVEKEVGVLCGYSWRLQNE